LPFLINQLAIFVCAYALNEEKLHSSSFYMIDLYDVRPFDEDISL
jgi:hypothetical protein